VPAGLLWWRSRPGGAAWLERLPRLVFECAARWHVEVGAPFQPASVAYVAPATPADGTPAVLKVNFPEAESEHEPGALAHWDGVGAVRLLAADAARRALLLERCEPGTQLWAVADEDEANRSAAEVLRALWRPPSTAQPGPSPLWGKPGWPPPSDEHPFRTLAGEARRWRAALPGEWERYGRPFERGLLERALGWIDELVESPSPGDAVVLHQDLHGGNVLRAARSPWLAIDPKPLVGERAFDLASLMRDRRDELAVDPAPVRRVRRRLDSLCADLDVDRERARRWAVVHALAWGCDDGGWDPAMVACAEWLDRA